MEREGGSPLLEPMANVVDYVVITVGDMEPKEGGLVRMGGSPLLEPRT